jgi:hypothetical protein
MYTRGCVRSDHEWKSIIREGKGRAGKELFRIPFGFLKAQLPASTFKSEAKPFSVRPREICTAECAIFCQGFYSVNLPPARWRSGVESL